MAGRRGQSMAHWLAIVCLATLGEATGHAATTEELATQPGIVSSEPIFTTAPFAQCHASTIVETPAGLVAAWFGGTKEGASDVGIWLSRRVDGVWSAPVEVANGAMTEDPVTHCLNPVLCQIPGGDLVLFYHTGKWWSYTLRSRDHGMTWSAPERLAHGWFGPVKNKPLVFEDGSLLCPAGTEFSDANERTWRVHFERYDRDLQELAMIGPVNDGLTIDAAQPTLLMHRSGRMQALGRTNRGRIFQIWSEDRGDTWGEMTLADLPNPNSGIDAVTLADGRALLAYNHVGVQADGSNGPRSPLNVAISHDGITWRGVLVLENQPGEFSYPALIQTADGLVHLTYTWRRQHIRHVVIDPAQLVPRSMSDGKWPTEVVTPLVITRDNADPVGVTIVGTWTTTTLTGSYAGNALYSVGAVGRSVRLAPELAIPGRYDVYLRWSAHDNRASNTRVEIQSAEGVTTTTVNQRIDGGRWNWLGRFAFARGTNGSVVVRSDEANGNVVADAAQWVLVESDYPTFYRAWSDDFSWPEPGAALPQADPDHDGLTNLAEFAFGEHPLKGDASLGVPQMQPDGTLGFRMRLGAVLEYEVEYSHDLTNWARWWSTRDGVGHPAVLSYDAEQEFASIRVIRILPLSPSALFWRVKITTAE